MLYLTTFPPHPAPTGYYRHQELSAPEVRRLVIGTDPRWVVSHLSFPTTAAMLSDLTGRRIAAQTNRAFTRENVPCPIDVGDLILYVNLRPETPRGKDPLVPRDCVFALELG